MSKLIKTIYLYLLLQLFIKAVLVEAVLEDGHIHFVNVELPTVE